MSENKLEWVKLESLEWSRTMKFKGETETVTLLSVTHIKKLCNAVMLKHKGGVFYFEKDQVQWINTNCKEWTV